jgi:hypothetical protein
MTRWIVPLCVLTGVLPAANAFEYALDDGTGNYTIGPSQFAAQMLWGNYFDAEPGFETITSISVAFAGSVPLGARVTVILFDDPTDDFDPTDALPLAQAIGTTVSAPPNTFIHFDLPATPVSGGFFVGALMDLQQHQTPARMDPQNPQGRSWLFFDDAIDLHDLGSAPVVYNMADTPFNGNWMVRAVGIPEPGMLLYGLLGGLLVRHRCARARLCPGTGRDISHKE